MASLFLSPAVHQALTENFGAAADDLSFAQDDALTAFGFGFFGGYVKYLLEDVLYVWVSPAIVRKLWTSTF